MTVQSGSSMGYLPLFVWQMWSRWRTHSGTPPRMRTDSVGSHGKGALRFQFFRVYGRHLGLAFGTVAEITDELRGVLSSFILAFALVRDLAVFRKPLQAVVGA